MEKKTPTSRVTHLTFVDLEETYDNVPTKKYAVLK